MRFDARRTLEPVLANYHKGMTVLALAGLVVSLGLLGVRAVVAKREQRAFDTWLGELTPSNPSVESASLVPFTEARRAYTKPFLFDEASLGTKGMFVPPTRSPCPWWDCRQPMEKTAEICPFCLRAPPEVRSREWEDKDGDFMDDDWEREVGLDPTDPNDAETDPDGDGYTSLEEFQAHKYLGEGTHTHPKDKMSCPPPWSFGKLQVSLAKGREFELTFMGVSIVGTHTNSLSNMVFSINDSSEDSYFVRIGETVKEFCVMSYEHKVVTNTSTGAVGIVITDESKITLKSEERTVVLVLGRKKEEWEKEAKLYFVPDDIEIEIDEKQTFTVRNSEYRVKTIDVNKQRVVIIDPALKKEVTLGSQGDKQVR